VNFIETAPGHQRGWNLLQKIGEGDAGEVFRVESLLDHKPAILKRPRRKAFPSDLIRQASQIQKEAEILGALSSIDSPGRMVHVPSILDQSRPGTEFTDRFFIVISPAPGFSLKQLAKITTLENAGGFLANDPDYQFISEWDRLFADRVSKFGKLPDFLLLRTILGLIEYLETIHSIQISHSSGPAQGIIWNDVKVDHVFWDPQTLQITLIDWGNSQFLDAGGVTKDRQYSRMSDYSQFLDEFHQFLPVVSAGLFEKLNWPEKPIPSNAYSEGVILIKEKGKNLFKEMDAARRKIRRTENDFIVKFQPSLEDLRKLETIQEKIIGMGELPDYSGWEKMALQIATGTIASDDLSTFGELCQHASQQPYLKPEFFRLLKKIADLNLPEEITKKAILAGLDRDWPSALWELRWVFLNHPEPAWWWDLYRSIVSLETGADRTRPYVAVNRLIHALNASRNGAQDALLVNDMISELEGTVLSRWVQSEPDPPDSGIGYHDVESALSKASGFDKGTADQVFQSLYQASSQSRIALDAWEQQDFFLARNVLRRIFFWDPDRLRLFTADKALEFAPQWIQQVRSGLTRDEPLQDFITRHELTGRELRNWVGPAVWLDRLLDAFSQLRKGAEPTDLLIQNPELRIDLDWLISLEPRRPLLSSPGKTVSLGRKEIPRDSSPSILGIKESPLGAKGGLILLDPLDTWASEARGSSARLFVGSLPTQSNERQVIAVKIMRPDRIDYALPLFREEAQILSLLRDVTGVIPLIELGFLHFDPASMPGEEKSESAENIHGEAVRYGLDSIHIFLTDLENRVASGWLPYLALEKYEREDNLLMLSDVGYTNGRFLPTLEGLAMSIQICDLLSSAHARNIIYRDHKILHYYWVEASNGIYMIDWNVAKRFPQGLSSAETQFDLVQFGARALHYVLTGRSAPGALPLGPNKPEEIEAAALHYSVNWTYDDQRLPKDIKEILAAALNGEYFSAKLLRDDLTAIYHKLSELVRSPGG